MTAEIIKAVLRPFSSIIGKSAVVLRVVLAKGWHQEFRSVNSEQGVQETQFRRCERIHSGRSSRVEQKSLHTEYRGICTDRLTCARIVYSSPS